MAMPIIVSVEAVIASGKSTLLELIEKRMGMKVHIVPEPVFEWQQVEGNEDHNVLELFYKDMSRWSFTFQMYVLLTRIRAIQNAVDLLVKEGRTDTVIIVERSVETGKETFARMLHDSGRISEIEWSMYNAWFAFVSEKAPRISGSVYMQASISTVMQRMKKRQRGEEGGITKEYQSELIRCTEEWVAAKQSVGFPMLVVDVETDFVENVDVLDRICGQINGFLETLQSEGTRCPSTPATLCSSAECHETDSCTSSTECGLPESPCDSTPVPEIRLTL